MKILVSEKIKKANFTILETQEDGWIPKWTQQNIKPLQKLLNFHFDMYYCFV